MKKKIWIPLNLVILLLVTITSNAQSYIPTIIKGRTWEITKPMGMGQSTTYSIRLACDTVINSLNYIKVNSSASTNLVVREDTLNHKIFYYNNVIGTDQVLIDYDISLGSTFNGMFVDSINYASYFGQNRKVIYFNNLVKWIEGIGNSFNGLSDTLNGYSYVTNVFNSDTSCAPLNNLEIEPNDLECKQTGSTIYFYSPLNSNISLRVYNSTGQVVKQLTFNGSTSLDLSNYASQLLYLEVVANNKRSIRRVFTY